MKMIKITSPGDGMVWYANHLEKLFEVVPKIPDDPDVYWVREPEGYLNIVYRKDCELLES